MSWGCLPLGAYYFPSLPAQGAELCEDGVYRVRLDKSQITQAIEKGLGGLIGEKTTLGADSTGPDDASGG